ncbi:phosphatidylinositol transfer protein 1-like isoform X2 [Mangifera indica]|uniref:phosphatidylinositol transfer protein 1-like isoform X1 n=2 Tax=Mangifera indica TaxID=29780 RepID=UPI001CFA94D0|nr:phosphatidylinositol transfer protein 1-like isoform X1 [Mangifera indica]XP_044506299.1 phosphatidylinositol transfer protein 1-like isoform X2 [Mangifera indica]
MVQIMEFRIVMPVSLEEYQIAQAYMVMKMQQQNSNGDEGVEVLENRPFENDLYGRGQFTSKVYQLQSKAPAWLTTFAPTDALVMQEEAWNAYPRCKTVIKCPYFTKFSLTIETIHKSDSGQSENVHNLSEEQLAARQVEVLDIASTARDYWSYAIGSNSTDFSTFKSKRTGRGPLLEGWQDRCNPVMTAYKLVTIDAPYWGFGYRLEQALLAGERALFLESHRNCFGWIDEWFGMTMPQIRQLERQSDSSLNQRIGKTTSKTTPEDFEQRFSCDEEIYSKSQEITDTRGL